MKKNQIVLLISIIVLLILIGPLGIGLAVIGWLFWLKWLKK